MTLEHFRKLFYKMNPDAEVIFSLTSGVRIHNCEVSGAVEENMNVEGQITEPVINVVLYIKGSTDKDNK